MSHPLIVYEYICLDKLNYPQSSRSQASHRLRPARPDHQVSRIAREASPLNASSQTRDPILELSGGVTEVTSIVPLDVSRPLRGNLFACSTPESQGCSLHYKAWVGGFTRSSSRGTIFCVVTHCSFRRLADYSARDQNSDHGEDSRHAAAGASHTGVSSRLIHVVCTWTACCCCVPYTSS